MNKKYQIIYADPPYQQGKGGKKNVRPLSSGGQLDYPTMSLQDIETILNKAKLLGEEKHNFFLWTIDKYLIESEQIMLRMGYKRHARIIWNKITGIAAAFTIRYGHEYLLWFYQGGLIPIEKDQRGKWHSVLTEQVKRHSQKPEIAYTFIESIYPKVAKLELFARNKRMTLMETWDVWGNEVECDIKL